MYQLILFQLATTTLAANVPTASAPPAVTTQIVSSEAQPIALSGGRTAQPAQDKKICKSLPSSYSRLPNRACLTEKEWKQVEDDQR